MASGQATEPVFSISPNPSAHYLSPYLTKGVSRIKRAIFLRQGLGLLLGDVGLGKSSLLRLIALDYQMNETKYVVSYLHDSRRFKTPFEFLRQIGSDFKIDPKRSQEKQIAAIEEFMDATYLAKKTIIVFVDEAQKLPLEILEHMRSLLNYETNTHKLIQFVLAGQLELQEKLLERRYRMVKDRVVAAILIKRQTLEEARQMILNRLQIWGIENPFTEEAISEIHNLAQGSPRRCLLLCQQSWDLVEEGSKVTATQVSEAFENLQVIEEDPQEL